MCDKPVYENAEIELKCHAGVERQYILFFPLPSMPRLLARRLVKKRVPSRSVPPDSNSLIGFFHRPINTNSAFHGDPVVVRRPEKYKGFFRKGESVLNVHFNASTPRETAYLLRETLRDVPLMKALGYKGIVGITSNQSLIRFARKIGANVFPVNRRVRREFRDVFNEAVKDGTGDKKYLSSRVMLVVWRFPQE